MALKNGKYRLLYSFTKNQPETLISDFCNSAVKLFSCDNVKLRIKRKIKVLQVIQNLWIKGELFLIIQTFHV